MNILQFIKHGVSFLLHGETPITTVQISVLSQNQLLRNRCALITGGTSGIGFSIAKTFLQSGASVIITGRNQDKIVKAQKELSSLGKIYGFVMNNKEISTFDSVFEKMLLTVREDGINSIDILVNNAGVLGANIPNATEDQFNNVIETNLRGVFFLSQMFGKYMVKNRIKGNILNIASSSSLRPAVSAYTVSKWGVRGLTMGLARSLAPHGITVNGIAPGQTATPMLKAEGDTNLTNPSCPLGRWILPEEIANGALFLVSDMGKAVVGDIIYMTGGSALLSYEDMNYNIF